MITNYTIKYMKNELGYTGQLLEWPDVISEGSSIEDCKAMVIDALNEMILAYKQLNKPIPIEETIFEVVSVDIDNVNQTA